MKLLVNPSPEKWRKQLARPVQKSKEINKIVKPILKKVERTGDKALIKFAQEYDHVSLDQLTVSKAEIEAASKLVSNDLKEAIHTAQANIEKFHAAQASEELILEVMPGVTCRRKSVPIQRVGLYVPGGTAPLFSTVLMLGVPAKLAGCKEIVL
ncbi:MAG: histidinol dehydrogenase, partial [Cytophagales bacterium]